MSYQEFLGVLLGNRERFFEEVVDGVGLGRKLWFSNPDHRAAGRVLRPGGGSVFGARSGRIRRDQAALPLLRALIAGVFGMYALHDGLGLVCEKRGVYPRKALTIMRAWAVLFAFVGVQLAWNLRPFLGDRNQPFRVFGTYQGNFYAAVIYAVNRLFAGASGPATTSRPADTLPFPQGLLTPAAPAPDSSSRTPRP